jgi:hypothetical protein
MSGYNPLTDNCKGYSLYETLQKIATECENVNLKHINVAGKERRTAIIWAAQHLKPPSEVKKNE